MSPKRLKNRMKPSFYPVQISKILPGGFAPEPPKPLPRLFLDPSYGPGLEEGLVVCAVISTNRFLDIFQ